MPVIGAMSAKIALHAGVLMFAARMNMHMVDAALDPSQPVTVVASAVGAYLGFDEAGQSPQQPPHRILIGIDHGEIPLRAVRVGPEAAPGGVLVGNDILREAPLLLDFGRQRLRLPEKAEARHIAAHMIPLATSVSPDGCLSIAATDATGRAIRIALVGRDVESTGERIAHLGDATISIGSENPTICTANDGVIGWGVFQKRQLLIDLAAGTLWMSR